MKHSIKENLFQICEMNNKIIEDKNKQINELLEVIKRKDKEIDKYKANNLPF